MTEETEVFEEKIVEYLSLYPRRCAMRIKMDMDELYRNYSVIKALSVMTKKGWLAYTQGRAEKKVIMKFYRLSALGVGVALAKNPEFKLLNTLETYKDRFPEFETLIQMVNTLQPEIATKLLRITGKHLLRVGEKGDYSDETMLKVISGLQVLVKAELEEIVRVADVNFAILERHYRKHQMTAQPLQEQKMGGLKRFFGRIT